MESWPQRFMMPSRKPRRRMPRLPIPAGKAHQKLSQAIICADDELASWLDRAMKLDMVTGQPHLIQELRTRLDAVMAPLDQPGVELLSA
jgi:hypothetical protein